MKTKTYALAVSILVITLSSTASIAAPPLVKKVPPPPDYFPLRVEDWWKYKSTTGDGKESEFTVKVMSQEKKDDGTVIFQVDTTSNWAIHDWYTKPKGLVHRLKEKMGDNDKMQVEYQPPYEVMENPLHKDHTWKWEGKGISNVDIVDNAEVQDSEKIVVPAGEFFAVKVVNHVVQGGSNVTKTYWYAPWIGLVKSKTETPAITSTTELQDYSFKKLPKDREKEVN